MTVKILCDKCGTAISTANLNDPAHRIIIDGSESQVCDPCFKENDYGNLLPGADNILGQPEPTKVQAPPPGVN